MDETTNLEPIDIKTMIDLAPDLFMASEQFLLIEPYLEKALK
jgi:hypothetical protein